MTDAGTGLRTMLARLGHGEDPSIRWADPWLRSLTSAAQAAEDFHRSMARLQATLETNGALERLKATMESFSIQPTAMPHLVMDGPTTYRVTAPTPAHHQPPRIPGVADMALTTLRDQAAHPVLPHSAEQRRHP